MRNEISIRPMTSADIDAVARIEKEVFTDPWPRSAFAESLAVSSRVNLVLELSDGSIAGYAMAQTASDEVQVHNIALTSSARRIGYGRLLLRRVEHEGVLRGARCSVLDVRAHNEPALALYQSVGYRMIGRRKDYYRRPVDDALILFRRLDGGAATDEV